MLQMLELPEVNVCYLKSVLYRDFSVCLLACPLLWMLLCMC